MNSKPRISVVMPVFNAARYLPEAIDSILAQTERSFEFLIYDDGSTDASVGLVRDYMKTDSRIVLHVGSHRGYSGWLNQGVRDASGEYLARMDADDISHPDRFSLQMKYLDTYPDVVAVGGRVLTIDPDGDPLDSWFLPLQHDEIDRNHLNGQTGGLVHPAAMFRRLTLTDAGGYRCEFEPAEDLDLWLRLAELGTLANLPEQVLEYREHPESVSQVARDRQLAAAQRAISEARSRRGLPAHRIPPRPVLGGEELLRDRFWRSWGAGNHRTSRKYALQIVSHRPWCPRSWLPLARTLFGASTRSFRRQMGRLFGVFKPTQNETAHRTSHCNV